MIQFNSGDICNLIRACETYKDRTGSEYMWDEFDALQTKLKHYGEEISDTNGLVCPQDK